MKRKIISALIVVCVIVAAFGIYEFALKEKPSYVENPGTAEVQKAFDMLNNAYLAEGEEAAVYYTDFINNNQYEAGEGEYTATLKDGITTEQYYNEHSEDSNVSESIKENTSNMKELGYQQKAEYTVNVSKAGLYYLYLDYTTVGSSMSDYTVSIAVNGKQDYTEMGTVALPLSWTDADGEISNEYCKKFTEDSYGDEMPQIQKLIKDWKMQYALYNNTYITSTPICFYLEAGDNTIAVENVSSGGLAVGSLNLKPAQDNTLSYDEYKATHSDARHVDTDEIVIDSVYYTEKNSTDAAYGSEANKSLTRFNIDKAQLNTLSWGGAGTEVTYTFDVKKTGTYNLALHFKNEKKEFQMFETIKIDGEVPFKEAYNYPLEYVASGWKNQTISDKNGTAYEFYLTEGRHTISLKQENAPVMEAYRYALLMEQHLTNFSLEIKKITGSEVDSERNWKMTKYIPEIEDYIESYKTLITYIRYLLQDYSTNGNNGAVLANLDKAEQFIKDIQKYPDDIALHIDDLTGAENSILVALSSFTTAATENMTTLDKLYIFSDEDQLGRENASFIDSTWVGIKKLVNTFTTSKYSTDAKETDDDVLTIWMNDSIVRIDLLQKMVDTEFTEKTGIKVKIATMPDINKLSLAIAADATPDIALGLASYVPFDLSSRGALYDLSQFSDFWSVANRFPTGSFVSYTYNEGVYALPESTDFNATVYRTDIFKNLGLEVPQTWDELVEILPTLQRYGMNFYHNIALGSVGYKWFYQTAPMILQNEGELYVQDENGLVKTGVDSKNGVRGLQVLGDLFTKYSVETSVNQFFNSFRYSVTPIGIASMEDYNLISNGAQELDGQWKLAPYIGTEQEDGVINRTFVANGKGGCIFKKSEKKEEAWKFMKWWTSQDAQVEFTNTLKSTYGKTYFWLSANIDALRDNPMDEADKQIVLEQINWVTDITRTPGQYLLERTISNIWTTMVFDGTSAQVAVDEAKVDVNREIVRKMRELGYYDDDGNMIKDFKLQGYDWIQEQKDAAAPEKEDK